MIRDVSPDENGLVSLYYAAVILLEEVESIYICIYENMWCTLYCALYT